VPAEGATDVFGEDQSVTYDLVASEQFGDAVAVRVEPSVGETR
jgi:hypothetical protein